MAEKILDTIATGKVSSMGKNKNKNKKPSPRTINDLQIAFNQEGLASVRAGAVSVYWSHLTKEQIREAMKTFQEFLDYEPPPWIPKKGGLFKLVEESRVGPPIVFMRLLNDQPRCPAGSFSMVQLTGSRMGRVGHASVEGKILTPATLKDLSEG